MRMKKYIPYLNVTCLLLVVLLSCGRKHSKIREEINKPENGYIREVTTPAYTLRIQYQPPAYRADQEIMLNQSTASRKELIKEYDQLQQFLVSYSMNNQDAYPGDFGNMGKFSLVANDTIPCIDAHQLPYSPGAPNHEVLLLFPISEKEMGKEFSMIVHGFPEENSSHIIKYSLAD
jgi:hypothetical protein